MLRLRQRQIGGNPCRISVSVRDEQGFPTGPRSCQSRRFRKPAVSPRPCERIPGPVILSYGVRDRLRPEGEALQQPSATNPVYFCYTREVRCCQHQGGLVCPSGVASCHDHPRHTGNRRRYRVHQDRAGMRPRYRRARKSRLPRWGSTRAPRRTPSSIGEGNTIGTLPFVKSPNPGSRGFKRGDLVRWGKHLGRP